MNNPPFSIGQKVVCLMSRGSRSGKVVKDNVYVVRNLKECCGKWSIDVGLVIKNNLRCYCSTCGSTLSSGVLWCHATLFAPIQTNYSDATTEILEKFKSPAETPDKILTPEKVTNQ